MSANGYCARLEKFEVPDAGPIRVWSTPWHCALPAGHDGFCQPHPLEREHEFDPYRIETAP